MGDRARKRAAERRHEEAIRETRRAWVVPTAVAVAIALLGTVGGLLATGDAGNEDTPNDPAEAVPLVINALDVTPIQDGQFSVRDLVQNVGSRTLRGCVTVVQPVTRDLQPLGFLPIRISPTPVGSVIAPGDPRDEGTLMTFPTNSAYATTRRGHLWLRVEIWVQCATRDVASESGFFDLQLDEPNAYRVPISRTAPVPTRRRPWPAMVVAAAKKSPCPVLGVTQCSLDPVEGAPAIGFFRKRP